MAVDFFSGEDAKYSPPQDPMIPEQCLQPCAPEALADVGDSLRRARATDPETSQAAAKRAALFAKGHASRILVALNALGSATAHELAGATGLTVVQIDRRLPELERAGKARVLALAGGVPLVRGGYRVWAGV